MTIRNYKKLSPQLSKDVYLDESAVVIGDVSIKEQSSVWPLCVIRGDVNSISIGTRTNIQDGTVIHVTRRSSGNSEGFPTVIGDDVTVGHKCMLHGCTIGDRVLVGMGAIVMDNVVIESDVVIGAGSVVPPNKHLLSGFLYVGNPAKQKRPLTNVERTFLTTSANNYVALKNDYMG